MRKDAKLFGKKCLNCGYTYGNHGVINSNCPKIIRGERIFLKTKKFKGK